jgi:hypothetical protein
MILIQNQQYFSLEGFESHDGEIVDVADGQSRLMTINLFILALNSYISKNNLPYKQLVPIDIGYEETAIQDEFTTFIENRQQKTRFSNVYKLMYKEISDHCWDIEGMIDAIKNCLIITFKITYDPIVGYDMFQQINSSGKPLDGKEFIHSTLKQYSKEYKVDMSYSFDKIVDLMKSYYKILEPLANSTFTNNVIRDFMSNHVTKSRDTLLTFRNYIMATQEFEKTTLYQSMSCLERTRVPKLVYALIAKGYRIDAENKDIKNLMLGLINFSILASATGKNPSGSTGEMFDEVTKMIALGASIKDVYKHVEQFVKKQFENNPVYIGNLMVLIDQLADKQHQAIMLADIWNNNHSARYENIWLEHSFANKANRIWTIEGWFDDEEVSNALYKSIGNKFLLKDKPNRECGNSYLDVKKHYYDEAFENDIGLATPLNRFDAERYHNERVMYAEYRKKQYINFLYNLPFGRIMIAKK